MNIYYEDVRKVPRTYHPDSLLTRKEVDELVTTSITGASLTSFNTKKLNINEFYTLRTLLLGGVTPTNNNSWAANVVSPNNDLTRFLTRYDGPKFDGSYVNSGNDPNILTLVTNPTTAIREVLIPFSEVENIGSASQDFFQLGSNPFSITCLKDGYINLKINLMHTASVTMPGASGNLAQLWLIILLPKLLVIEHFDSVSNSWVECFDYLIDTNTWSDRNYYGRNIQRIDIILKIHVQDELRFKIRDNDQNLRDNEMNFHLLVDPKYTNMTLNYV